jgi:hypothetical protein
MELDVEREELRLVVALAGRPHPRGGGDEGARLRGRGPLRRESRGLGLDRTTQLSDRPELPQPALRGQALADRLRA